MFKNYIQKKIEKYVKQYIAKHGPKLVLVTGSVGKTSTKLAIATVLSQKYRVRVHDGNHNTHMSVPLGILGIAYPDNIRSIGAWLAVRKAAKQRIKSKTNDCDVIVQELGTDTPGDIAHFGTYLYADISVVTAVSPEHMEFFKTIEAVAEEELAVSNFSRLTIINRDDIPAEFARLITTASIDTYGLSGAAEYRFVAEDESLQGATGKFIGPGLGEVPVSLKVSGESGQKSVVAAGVVGTKLGLTPEEIAAGIANINPVPGRMNILRGLKETTLIDDTYNSSPLAMQVALKSLYSVDAPQRIAILGDMNELGDVSASEHEKVGQLCDPGLLAWVITIGPQSEKYLAPAALARGCQVKSFKDPVSAGSFAHAVLEQGAIVLVKGSQNGVFAEEALKLLLHETEEEHQLVRQSPKWLAEKKKQFDNI